MIFLPDDPEVSVVEDEVNVEDDNDDDDGDAIPVVLDNVENFRLQHEADGNLSLQNLVPGEDMVSASAANRLIGEVVQSRRRPLLGPSPG